MSKKLYVGNLAYTVTDETLNQLFTQFGTVESAKVIMDNFSGRSKGFGFVEMANDAEAAEAISKLNGQEHEGRALNVNEARPKEPRSGGFGGERRPGGGGGRGRGGFGGGGEKRNRW